MLDIKKMREDPDAVRNGLLRVGSDPHAVDSVLRCDDERRILETQIGQLRNQRNVGSKDIGKIADGDQREALKTAMRQIGDEIAGLERQLHAVEEAQRNLMLHIPNLPHPHTPDGKDDSENVVIKVVGDQRKFDFVPKPHWEIGTALGILDLERGVKISGSRFYVLKGAGAALQRALITWFLDVHTLNHGYTEIYPPAIVKEHCLVGTGNLPKFGDNLYRDIEEDFWLVPTAEVPITNLHRDEILDADQLPIKYVAYSPCFRREKMSAGRDVRGIKRGHQFDKVEMVKICTAENGEAELEALVQDASDICVGLDIPYRVLQMCAGDLSFVSALKYDLEMWAPACGDGGAGEWLEVSSCGLFTDFQARRANIRYRPEKGAKPEFVTTLNGSGLALPRVVIAILENYQNEDGSVTIPPVLRPYMHGVEVISKAG